MGIKLRVVIKILQFLVLPTICLSGCVTENNIIRESEFDEVDLAASVSADSPSGTILGIVSDPAQRPIHDAMITVAHMTSQFGDVQFTSRHGRYQIDKLQPGEYMFVVSKDGYSTISERVLITSSSPSITNVVVNEAFGIGKANEVRPKNYSVIELFYGTDRARKNINGSLAQYSGLRGNDFQYGVAKIAIPRDHKLGSFESPRIWRLEFFPNPKKHISLLSTNLGDQNDLVNQLSKTSSALVFVHGFNVSFQDAARRAGQLFYDLQYNGTPVLYSWPSNGKTLSYLSDLDNAERSSTRFAEFISMISAHSETVHIIAHSMGSQVVLRGLELVADDEDIEKPLINEIALVAPDVDAEIFIENASQYLPVANRTTLYISSTDEALILSKRLRGGYPRLGDFDKEKGPVVMKELDTVDVSSLETGLLGHSYYGDNKSVVSDLFNLITNGLSPKDRFGLEVSTFNQKEFWRFVP